MGFFNKIVLKLAGTSEELEAIYKEKGPCKEYADGYAAINENKGLLDKCHAAEKYLNIFDYQRAEQILNSVSYPKFPNDDQEGTYNSMKLILCVNTNRVKEALNIMNNHGKMLNIFWGSPVYAPVSAPYYDCVATFFALTGDEERAMYWLNLEADINLKHDKTGVLNKISKCNVLFALKKAGAQTEYESTKQYIEDNQNYTEPWQKEYFLKMLEHSTTFGSF